MKQRIAAVGVVFEDENGEILVLRRLKSSREGNTWGLVGGNIDAGEVSLQAVTRETHEEIGYEVNPKDLEFVKSYTWEHEDAFISFDLFLYKVERSLVEVRLDTNENTEHEWVRPKDLYQRENLMKGLYPILEDLYKI